MICAGPDPDRDLDCDAPARFLVESGDPKVGPHAMASACDGCLEAVKRWAAGKTALTPTVTLRRDAQLSVFDDPALL